MTTSRSGIIYKPATDTCIDGVPLERAIGALFMTWFFVPKSTKLSTLLTIAALPLTIAAIADGEPRRNCIVSRKPKP